MAKGNAYACHQLRRAKGLGYVIVSAQVQRFHLVLFPVAGGKDYYGHTRPLADVSDYFYSVHIAEAQVQQHHIRAMGGDRRHGLAARAYRKHFVVIGVEYGGKQMDYSLVVLNYQYDG